MIRTMLNGWKRHKNHPDPCVRARLANEISPLKTTYAAAVWAMRQWYRHDPRMHAMMDSILSDLYREFGWKTRILVPVMGVVAFLALGREQRRLASGWTYEPKTFYEKNALALEQEVSAQTVQYRCRAPLPVFVDPDLPVHDPMPPEAAPPRAL
jgi:hypothetical protein